MKKPILNYNRALKSFDFDTEIIDELSLNSRSGKTPSFRDYASSQLFNEKKYIIFKNFISKDISLKLKDYYSNQMYESFQKVDLMHRLFYYLNSPFKYPDLITKIITKVLDFKNYIYQYHDYHQNYCLKFNLNPQKIESVTQSQLLHTWQAVYLYKDGCKFPKHIDYYGELACFLILSEKGKDYEQGGIEITYKNGDKILLDDQYEYGDLVFLVQASIFHEVKEIKTQNNQIGRLQMYFPTIPVNYMQKKLFFEGSSRPFFSNPMISKAEKNIELIKSFFSTNEIHYSRKNIRQQKLDL